MKAVATPELEIERQLIQQLTSGESQWTYREDLIKGIQTLLECYPNRYLQDSTLLGGQ